MVTVFLYANAQSRPAHAALVHGNERLNHADLLERVERLAHGLAARGIGPGDAVALRLPNGPAFVTAFFAITGLGAVVVPLNPRFERDFRPPSCDVREVISDERVVERLIEDHSPRPLEPRAPEETFVHQFSSGSTGPPKRVPRTHGQIWAEAQSYSFVESGDRVLCAIPLFHAYGTGCCLLAAIRHGATLYFLDEPHPFVPRPERTLELLERERVTVFPGVPLDFRHLADAPAAADLSSLRLCFSAGTALPRDTFDAFATRFGVPVRQLYGCTEAGTVTANLDPDPVASFESAGTPVGDVDVLIVDGEIAVSSPAMTDGYSDMEELNRRVFRDGWFLTGDLGRLDGAGRLYVTGRDELARRPVGKVLREHLV
jgi:long-chain acyl-CoA synthetase